MRNILFVALLIATSAFCSATLSVEAANTVKINEISFDLNLYADTRVATDTYSQIIFEVSSKSEAGTISITYSSPQMDVDVVFSPREQYDASAWLVSVNASCKQELYLHDVYLSMDSPDAPINAHLKGIKAIHSGDFTDNVTITPFRDKAVEFTHPGGNFWIVASGFDECAGVEGLTANRIVLYDYKGHFFRRYVQGGTWEQMMDTMYKPSGSSHEWSFLLFAEKPLLLDINRWPADNKAALCITNDADGENLNSLKAVYEGSNNPENPKYYSKGFFARNIPVSSTVFGCNQELLGEMWANIKDHGNAIGYHTYTQSLDPTGINSQALLSDLVPYNIRLWIDHAVPANPEDVCYQGLNPESDSYVADAINASNIDYIWPGDTPYTNPFNVYDEVWRLPHLVYEAKALTRPIWFFGRTRMEFWGYTNFLAPLSMKYLMTADNLDKLIEDRGLHISYTHFSVHSNSYIQAFFEIADNGDYEVLDEVDDMLLMLDYYRTHRGLWIDTLENIFDRMLAVEQVQVVSIERADKGIHRVVLQNASDYDLDYLSFRYMDASYSIPHFAQGDTYTFYAAEDPGSISIDPQNHILSYSNGNLLLKNRYDLILSPMDIDIFNIRGQKVKSFRIHENMQQWVQSFQNYASGIYFARITANEGPRSTIKFIVVK